MATAVAYLGGCGSDAPGTDLGEPYKNPLAGTLFEGKATAKALVSLLAPTPVDAPSRYAVIDAPADGAILGASDSLRFHWQVVEAMHGSIPRGSTGVDPFGVAREPAPKWAFSSLFGVKTAHAGPPPMNGRGYLIAMQKDGTDTVLSVFTTETDYTPDASAIAKLRAAGDDGFSAWVMIGDFEDDRLVAGTGPFKGPWIVLAFAK